MVKTRLAFATVAFVIAMLVDCGGYGAYATDPERFPRFDRELIVGTKDAPPFAMKTADGAWTGISIDLWRRIAQENQIRFRFVDEGTVQNLVDGVAAGRLDAAVAALTVTAPRERLLDFSSSFYGTGLGIAVSASRDPSWTPVIRAITSFGFIQAVLALIGLALAVGLVVWIFERRHNEDFGGSLTKGLSSSVWWTTVAMTQRGIGNFGPRTLPGRMVAILWMVGSIIAIAVFTAGVTSALTVKHLQGSVQGVTDLSVVRVGAVAGTTTEDVLTRMRIRFDSFPTAMQGLRAVRQGQIDAFVYDRPLLTWLVNKDFRSTLQMLDTTFDPQQYAIALPGNSPLRKPLSVAILSLTQSDWWDQTLFRYLGSR